MDDKLREDIALFRFGVISELASSRLDPGELTGLIKKKSEQRWHIPGTSRTRISTATIRRWLRLYENSNRELSSLYPVRRCDRGSNRSIDEETVAALVRVRKQKPTLPVKRLIEELTAKNLLPPGAHLSLTTAYRILKREADKDGTSATKTDRRRYEAEFPNDIWQSDVMHGPKVMVHERLRKTYLIAFLDDHSRLIPHGEFFLSERLSSWLSAFRQALRTRGLPRKLYVDNGATFRSRHLERICASLGIALIHSAPYTPQGRGKIERLFRTVRSRFLQHTDTSLTLAEINRLFKQWLETDYQHKTHSATSMTPFNRFAAHIEMVRAAPANLEDYFRKEVRRRVSRDRVVTIDGRLFEAPTQLIGERVRLLFNEEQPHQVEVFFKGHSYGLLIPVDLGVNCAVRRDKNSGELLQTDERAWRQGLLPFNKKE